jgi:hypothetical protein
MEPRQTRHPIHIPLENATRLDDPLTAQLNKLVPELSLPQRGEVQEATASPTPAAEP